MNVRINRRSLAPEQRREAGRRSGISTRRRATLQPDIMDRAAPVSLSSVGGGRTP